MEDTIRNILTEYIKNNPLSYDEQDFIWTLFSEFVTEYKDTKEYFDNSEIKIEINAQLDAMLFNLTDDDNE